MPSTTNPRRVAAAERGLPRQYTPDDVTGQLGHATGAARLFYVFGASSPLRLGGRPGWLTTWGYLADTGSYGAGRYPQFEGKAGDVDLVAELRAVFNAIRLPIKDGPVTVVTRRSAVAHQLLKWKSGSTGLPEGYTGSGRRPPMLEQLRRTVAAHAERLTILTEVAGNPLGEGAEALTDLAGWWARENRDKTVIAERAAKLAEAFLSDSERLDRGRR